MSSTAQETPSTSSSSTSNIQSIIDAALADYTKLTGTDLSKTPFATALEQSNSAGAVLQLLQDRAEAFKEYREGNRKLIDSLSLAVKVIYALSGIIGHVVSHIPFPPAKALLSGIDTLLNTAKGVSSSYDALLELFECLGNYLKRLEIYTTIPPASIVTDVVIKIMVELLSVLALASKQIKQGRLVKFTKKLRGESEIEAVLQRLDRLTREEAQMTVAQTLGVVHGLVGNMKVVMEDGKASTDHIQRHLVTIRQILNNINKTQRDQLQKDVHHWLSPPNPSTNQNFVRKARHKGTAAWFFESDTLTEWKAKGSLLWIHGKPGAGKSTLLSAIIQDVERMDEAGLATMAYYYFDFRDVKKQDCYGLLTSLVSQLSAESDSCYNILSKLYSDNKNGMREPDIDSLKECMKDMLNLPGQGPIYIIVDALDECPNLSGRPSAREEVLELIGELVDLELPNLHLCVASRPEMDIRVALEPLTTLRISLHDEAGQKEDIVEYIKSAVYSDRNMKRWKEEDKQLVVVTLSVKVDGMFRWAVCQVDRLCRTFPASIRNVLDDLPESLDETYDRTLMGIDKEKREYAQRLFRCLVVSVRPLRVEELAEVLAIRFPNAAPPTFNAAWRPDNAEEAVLSACSSLIVIIDKECHKVVQFSHFSVKEYLTSERLATAEERLSYYHILPEPAHTTLAHISLSVLLRLDDKINRDAITHFPLAPYAARYWVDHAKFGDVSSQIQEVMKHMFDPSEPHFASWVWLYDIDRYWTKPMSTIQPTRPDAVPIYYASLCGFGGLVEHLIAAHSSDVDTRGGFHTTPLHAASVKGHSAVASLLVKHGADPNCRDDLGRVPLHRISQGGKFVRLKSLHEVARLLVNSGAGVNVTDDDGDTPLHAAARCGYRDIAELLLESGASLDVRNDSGATPLYTACNSGQLDVSRFLIDRGSDINSRIKNDRTLLQSASYGGHLDIALLLLNYGIDVSAHTKGCWTALHFVSAKGHFATAKLLIDHGANVDSRNDNQETPLALASCFGHLDLVHLLINSGADVSARDIYGCSSFHMSSHQGHLPVVKYWLEYGINVDSRIGIGRTSLHLACSTGKFDVVRFLIRQGADIHVTDDSGSNPVQLASGNGHLDVVQLLIDIGVAINVWNGSQMTPLALASREGKVEVARFLIEQGADMNARDNKSLAPLHHASERGHLEMVRLLLDHDVNLNTQRDDLSSPLHLASANGHIKVAELLVQRGASVDLSNDKQETPLCRAVWNGKVAIARFLIEYGANLHTVDSNGSSLLHVASHKGHLEVVELLLRRGADVDVVNKANKTAAELASEAGIAKVISEYKADGNVRNQIRSNTIDTAEHGADEDVKIEGEVWLHAVAEEGEIDVVKSLLERGVDVNSRSASGETPLDRAAEKGKVDVVRLLIERGGEVNSRDKWGWTPLHEASRFGHLEVSRILIDHGADVGAVNGRGQTPYQLSLAYGYREVGNLLREHGAGGERFSTA